MKNIWKGKVCIGLCVMALMSMIASFSIEAADTACLWTLDANGNLVATNVYGPYSGWMALSYSQQTDGSRKRLLWRHTDGTALLWTLDASGNLVSTLPYGPYAGWTVEDYSHNGTTGRLVWNHTNGSVVVWTLNASDALVSTQSYGPYSGWMALSYSQQTDGSRKRLLWRHTDGTALLWTLDASGNLASIMSYGPYAGWTVDDYWHDGTTGKLVWNHTDGTVLVWTLNASDALVSIQSYGPYSGWSARAYHGTSGGGSASKTFSLEVLTVKKTGSGAGTIATGAQLCDVTCQELSVPYVTGKQVDLQVTPGVGSVFVGWQTADGVALENIYYANPGDTVYAIFDQQ